MVGLILYWQYMGKQQSKLILKKLKPGGEICFDLYVSYLLENEKKKRSGMPRPQKQKVINDMRINPRL